MPGPKLDSQQIELIGVAALEAELIRQGFEVARPNRDKGIDLIAFVDEPVFRAVPIQIKASSQRAFGVYRKYERFDKMIFVYIWDALSDPLYFIVPYRDACALIPEAQQKTQSWLREDDKAGYYWTRNQVPKHVLENLQKYENRWDLIKELLS